MKKFLAFIICCVMAISAYSQVPKLKFHDGKFKILQLTDLHWVVSDSYKEKNDSTYNLIRKLIHTERPDVVIMTGDVVVSWNARKGWTRLLGLFEEEKMPFAVALGNHDEETDMTRDEIIEFIQPCPYNLTRDEVPELTGAGNCVLPVLSSDGKSEKWMLYLFDSRNIVTNRTFGYYDWIRHDQIDWYRGISDKVAKRYNKPLPSLAFFHIPFPEFETGRWTCAEFGNKLEGVCAPSVNSGLYSSFIEKKDVIGVFAGHDHNNDYMIDMDGNLAMAYGRKTGYPSAYEEKLPRGGRIINLFENEAAFETYVRDLQGTSLRYVFQQKNVGAMAPSFSGTFIQDFLADNWDDARWDKEMQMLKEAGMTNLIYAATMWTDPQGKTYSAYPSSLTKKKAQKRSLENCLRSAQKNGVRVFVGLNFDDQWWKASADAEWLKAQMEKGNKIADEILALYKSSYPDALYGWYWTWEVANINELSKPENQTLLANALNINLDHLTKVSPEMPFMLSPYMNYKLEMGAEAYSKMWKSAFAQTHFRLGDIFCPQDCVGAGGLTLDNVGDWFAKMKQAVNSKPGLKYWGNVETFDQYSTSASLERVAKQLDIVNGYVGNLVCFSYCHYNSPFEVNADNHKAYCEYRKTGKLPKIEAPQAVSGVAVKKVAKGMQISWKPGNMDHVDGYSIYRNGELVRKLQVKAGKAPTSFTDKDGNMDSVYEVAAYNVLGKESAKVK